MLFNEFYDNWKLVESDILTEANKKELLAKIDPNKFHHADNYKKLPELSPSGAVYRRMNIIKNNGKDELEMWFETRGATYKNHPWWVQRVVMINLLDQLKVSQNIERTVRDAIENNDLLLGCTCPNFSFGGLEYINNKDKTNHPRFRETRRPNLTNPELKGIMCKHLHLVLVYAGNNTYKMVSDIKKLNIIGNTNTPIKGKEDEQNQFKDNREIKK